MAAAPSDQRDGPTATSQAGEERTVRALDFSQPTKFTPEVRRRLSGALTTFCEVAKGGLEAELRCDVELEVGAEGQHTWAAAKALLPAESLAVAVHAGAPDRQLLLSVELPMIFQALECMLGGEATETPGAHHLGEVDWVLARDLLDKLVADLSPVWMELGGSELERGDLDLEGDAGLLVAGSHPTLSITIKTQLGGLPSTFTILIPWACVEPLVERMHGVAEAMEAGSGDMAGELGRGVAGAHVLMRAEVGSVQMPIERMLAIAPGTVVELGGRAEDGVRLIAGEVSVARGKPGCSGTRRAVKLLHTDETPTRCEIYARLGRGELERARAHVEGDTDVHAADAPILRNIFVRVWAELGRTHKALGETLELAEGSVVELDQAADSPVELFANGLCFANGSLVVTPGGAWGIEVKALV